jgi:DNA-binding helix-hairpin-helix protein with protein kinase domain
MKTTATLDRIPDGLRGTDGQPIEVGDRIARGGEGSWPTQLVAAWTSVRSEADDLIEVYRGLAAEQAKSRKEVDGQDQKQQLQEHLARFRIGGTKIPQVGRTRMGTLQAYGIQTAADITKQALAQIPGLGAGGWNVWQWRQECAASFSYVPNKFTAQILNRIDSEYRGKRADLVVKLQAIAGRLERARLSDMQRIERVTNDLASARLAYAHAKADLNLL